MIDIRDTEYTKNLSEAIRLILDCLVRNENGIHSPYELPLFNADMNKKNAIWNLNRKTYEDLTGIYDLLESFNNYKRLDVETVVFTKKDK